MREHAAVFTDFTVQDPVETGEDIVTIIITYDSKYAVCITTKGDEEYFLKSYDLAAQRSSESSESHLSTPQTQSA